MARNVVLNTNESGREPRRTGFNIMTFLCVSQRRGGPFVAGKVGAESPWCWCRVMLPAHQPRSLSQQAVGELGEGADSGCGDCVGHIRPRGVGTGRRKQYGCRMAEGAAGLGHLDTKHDWDGAWHSRGRGAQPGEARRGGRCWCVLFVEEGPHRASSTHYRSRSLLGSGMDGVRSSETQATGRSGSSTRQVPG